MNIKIYQINVDRDIDRAAFMGTWMLERRNRNKQIDFSIYDLVYEGNPNCATLEDVFEMFNINHPKEYKGHSLSVSDIVKVVGHKEVEDGYYFCDSLGWKKLDENFNY